MYIHCACGNDDNSNLTFGNLFDLCHTYNNNFRIISNEFQKIDLLEDIDVDRFRNRSVTLGNSISLFRSFISKRQSLIDPLRPQLEELYYFTNSEDREEVKYWRNICRDFKYETVQNLKPCSVNLMRINLSKTNIIQIKKDFNLTAINFSIRKLPKPKKAKLKPLGIQRVISDNNKQRKTKIKVENNSVYSQSKKTRSYFKRLKEQIFPTEPHSHVAEQPKCVSGNVQVQHGTSISPCVIVVDPIDQRKTESPHKQPDLETKDSYVPDLSFRESATLQISPCSVILEPLNTKFRGVKRKSAEISDTGRNLRPHVTKKNYRNSSSDICQFSSISNSDYSHGGDCSVISISSSSSLKPDIIEISDSDSLSQNIINDYLFSNSVRSHTKDRLLSSESFESLSVCV